VFVKVFQVEKQKVDENNFISFSSPPINVLSEEKIFFQVSLFLVIKVDNGKVTFFSTRMH
jgi:hypothetical protein